MDREPAFTLSLELEYGGWGVGGKFLWSPLVGKCGILDVAWAPRTLLMVHGHLEAELGSITEFMWEKEVFVN